MSEIIFSVSERLTMPRTAALHLIELVNAAILVRQRFDQGEVVSISEALADCKGKHGEAMLADLQALDLGRDIFDCVNEMEVLEIVDPYDGETVPNGSVIVAVDPGECEAFEIFIAALHLTMRRFKLDGEHVIRWLSVCARGRSAPAFGVAAISAQGIGEMGTTDIANMALEKMRGDVDRALQINMADHFDYDEPNTPEWAWIEKHACFQHTGNGEMGVWEFIVHESELDDAEMPQALRDIISAKMPKHGVHYVIFHQGT